MAIEKTVNLNIKAKGADKVDKDFKDISKDLNDIKAKASKAFDPSKVKPFNNEVKKTETVVKSVKNRLRELEDEMADIGDIGSPQFRKLAKEAGALKDKVNNAKAATKAMSADFPNLQLGVQAFQAIGAASQVAMGASMLFGSENEEITKGIQKMMAVQTIMNGINTIANALSDETALGMKVRGSLSKITTANELKSAAATKGLTIAQKAQTVATWVGNGAMKALNAVMNMNPIFLIITLLAALGAAWMAFGSEAKTAEDDQNSLNDSMDRYLLLLEQTRARTAKDHSNAMRIMALEGATNKDFHDKKIENIKRENHNRSESLRLNSAYVKKAKVNYAKALKEEEWELAKTIREKIDATRKSNKALKLENTSFHIDIREENADFAEKEQADKDKAAATAAANASKWAAAAKARRQDEANARLNIERLTIDQITDDQTRLTEKAEFDHQAKLTSLKGNASQVAEQTALLEVDLHEKLKDIREKYAIEALEVKALDKEQSTIDAENKAIADQEILDAGLASLVKHHADQKKVKDKAAENDKKLNALKVDIAKGGFQAISDIAGLFAGKSLTSQKRAFNVQKAAGIASATVDTVLGAQKAYVSQMAIPSPDAPIRAALAATAAGISGAARVATIAKTKFEGGSAASLSSGGGGGGGGSVGGQVSAPAQFNQIGDSGTNQIAESLNGGAVKAYVVGGDVTSQQSIDRNKTELSSI